ncbi:MAG: bifunctional hydroxymethylpyrimidine kinase/phosphomethylpyrimidine kinase [Novosphingobium sp.]
MSAQQPMTPPRILVIAGSDSSGGAGIQADIKTITMLGGYAMTAITAVTAQNSTGVFAVEVLSPALVGAQIDACISDIGVDAVKIGMLGSPEIAKVVADRLQGIFVPIVFDPVMVATSGAALAGAETIAAFEGLMALATLTTPNVAELAALGGDAGMAARGVAYLAKGGDADGDIIQDRLIVPGKEPVIWRAPRIATRHTHGTGCTLSSAIATLLGRHLPDPSDRRERDTGKMIEAITLAREFTRAALVEAPGFGAGQGPLGHQAIKLKFLPVPGEE